ncbi:OVCH2 protein, partial [Polypterus senegalus]
MESCQFNGNMLHGKGYNRSKRLPRLRVTSVTAVVGSDNLRKASSNEQILKIDIYRIHPQFDSSNPVNYDICVIRVTEKIVFGSSVQPICLPSPDTNFQPGTLCTVSGWGKTSEGGTVSQTLQRVHLPLLPTAECNLVLINAGVGEIDVTMLCAGFPEGGRDACQGDSGGPLFCQQGTGPWFLMGVTSWGIGCARKWSTNDPNHSGTPGIFANVKALITYIFEQTSCKICGNTPPAPFLTESNKVELQFVSDISYSGKGFELQYTAVLKSGSGCGSIAKLNQPGTIDSFNYPFPYSANSDCIWKVVAGMNQVVKIRFIDFEVEESLDCTYDSVSIFNDFERHLPIDGHPPGLVKCLSFPQGSLGIGVGGSPVGSRTYRQGVLCLGLLSPYGQQLHHTWKCRQSLVIKHLEHFQVLEVLDILMHPNFTLYNSEYNIAMVKVQEVIVDEYVSPGEVGDPLVCLKDGKYTLYGLQSGLTCGEGSWLFSRVRVMLDWIEAVQAKESVIPDNVATLDSGECPDDQPLISPQGSFHSPGYPYYYDGCLNCSWTVYSSLNSQVVLDIIEISIMESPNCEKAYLSICEESNDGARHLLGHFYGEGLPPSVKSSGSEMTIVFNASCNFTDSGFVLQYFFLNVSEAACPEFMLLKELPGELKSPNYPNPYYNNLKCVWTIYTTSGHRILVKIKDFSLEDGKTAWDKLIIHDGPNVDAVIIDTLSGTQNPRNLISSGNFVTLVLETDASVVGHGFRIEYSDTTQSTNINPGIQDMDKYPCGFPKFRPWETQAKGMQSTEAFPYSMPWVTSLQANGIHYCIGALIHPEWVIAPWHCNFNTMTDKVVLGAYDLSSEVESLQHISVKEKYEHEDCGGFPPSNDIILLHLTRPVQLGDTVIPVCLPEEDFKIDDDWSCLTAGWRNVDPEGMLQGGMRTADELMLFTDESRFCLTRGDGRIRVYRRWNERYTEACTLERDRWLGPFPPEMSRNLQMPWWKSGVTSHSKN